MLVDNDASSSVEGEGGVVARSAIGGLAGNCKVVKMQLVFEIVPFSLFLVQSMSEHIKWQRFIHDADIKAVMTKHHQMTNKEFYSKGKLNSPKLYESGYEPPKCKDIKRMRFSVWVEATEGLSLQHQQGLTLHSMYFQRELTDYARRLGNYTLGKGFESWFQCLARVLIYDMDDNLRKVDKLKLWATHSMYKIPAHVLALSAAGLTVSTRVHMRAAERVWARNMASHCMKVAEEQFEINKLNRTTMQYSNSPTSRVLNFYPLRSYCALARKLSNDHLKSDIIQDLMAFHSKLTGRKVEAKCMEFGVLYTTEDTEQGVMHTDFTDPMWS